MCESKRKDKTTGVDGTINCFIYRYRKVPTRVRGFVNYNRPGDTNWGQHNNIKSTLENFTT